MREAKYLFVVAIRRSRRYSLSCIRNELLWKFLSYLVYIIFLLHFYTIFVEVSVYTVCN